MVFVYLKSCFKTSGASHPKRWLGTRHVRCFLFIFVKHFLLLLFGQQVLARNAQRQMTMLVAECKVPHEFPIFILSDIVHIKFLFETHHGWWVCVRRVRFILCYFYIFLTKLYQRPLSKRARTIPKAVNVETGNA